MSTSDTPRHLTKSILRGSAACFALAWLLGSRGMALAQTESSTNAAAEHTDPSQGHRPRPSVHDAMATKLFDEGQQLMASGDPKSACKKFETSLSIVKGAGTQFNLADCYEKLERIVEAHALFLEVAETTKAAGEQQRFQLAFARAQALEALLGSLSIEFSTAAPPNLVVLLDNKPLPRGSAHRPYFVDPGEHSLRASAPGKRDWSDTVSVAAGESLEIRVPELESVEKHESAQRSDDRLRTQERDRSAQVEESGSGWTWVPPLALGVGAVGLFTGIAYTQQYRSSHAEAQTVCPSNFDCTREEAERHDRLVDDSRRARQWAVLGYSVAGAGLAVTVSAYIWRPDPPPEATATASLSVTPLLGAGFGGGSISGSF